VKYHEYEAHPILRDSVKCFWIHEATYPEDVEQDIAPDGCVELILNFGDPYLLRRGDSSSPLPAAVIVGFRNKPIPLIFRGTLRVVAARLFAWGAMALLQDNVGALTGAFTSPGPDWDGLMPRLRAHVMDGRYETAARSLEELLIQRALVRRFDAKLIQSAAKMLHHTKGQYRIADLADACHMSTRQLERGFQKIIGATPKSFARTMRFEQAQRRLMFEPDADLAGLAVEGGYFDQAHFIKEFKEFAGKTPGEYAVEMRKLREILTARDVVFLQSSSDAST
jgi:AraC-like DNA-binding protein